MSHMEASLLCLPDDLLALTLSHVYESATSAALEEMSCFVESAAELRHRRKVLRAASGAMVLGNTCRRFSNLHAAAVRGRCGLRKPSTCSGRCATALSGLSCWPQPRTRTLPIGRAAGAHSHPRRSSLTRNGS